MPTRRIWTCVVVVALVLLATTSPAHAQFAGGWLRWLEFDWIDAYVQDTQAAPDDTWFTTVPDMFGDTFGRGGSLVATNAVSPAATSRADVLLAGGSRGLKVAELNKAIPMNRVYAAYNHFHNAVRTEVFGSALDVPTPVDASSPVDRMTVGFERRFGCELWSLEMRMPFTTGHSFVDPNGLVTNRAGEIGNLSAIVKRMVYYDDQTSIVAGIGVELPTGEDFTSTFDVLPSVVRYAVSNDAVHLHPFFGLLSSRGDRLFYHAFAQMDVPLNGNAVAFTDAVGVNSAGRYTDQALFYADLGAGYWLYRNPCGYRLTGLAALLELHYTTALNGTDVVAGAPVTAGTQVFTISNLANRFDVLNLTAALNFAMGSATSLRIGGVVPLQNDDDRFFDAELTIQLIRTL